MDRACLLQAPTLSSAAFTRPTSGSTGSGTSSDRTIARRPERKVRHREEFIALFAERANLSDSTDVERALGAATSALSSHVTPGELDDLIAQLPSDLLSVLH